MCMSSGDGGAGAARKQQKQQQAAIESATGQINKSFSGFDDNFYNQRAKAYEQFALPQLGQQFKGTQDALGYSLAGKGLTNSSAARKLGESLGTELNNQKQQIGNNALAQSGQLKQNIENQRATLISEANAANDPASISNQAIGVASGFQAPSMLQPVGQMFSNWANMYLGSKNAQTYNPITSSVYLPNSSLAGGYGSSLMNPVSYGGR